MSDTDKLRKIAVNSNDGYLCGPALFAADEIDRLRAENVRLREALEAMVDRHVLYCGGESLPFAGHTDKAILGTARAALKETDNG